MPDFPAVVVQIMQDEGEMRTERLSVRLDEDE